jgi:hypothetical protein
MKNICGNVKHWIYVLFDDECDGNIEIIHKKAESGGWGDVEWELGIHTDSKGENLLKVWFNPTNLKFNVRK